MTEPTVTMLTHVRVQLALHELRAGVGRPLLLLHGLGERTPDAVPHAALAWPGPVFGLDLTGHGRSSRTVGGGYTAEVLMADVDAALAHLGPATVLGRGLGAYVALLIAGARPTLVRGAVLADGPGLAGGGPAPHSPVVVAPPGVEAGDEAGDAAARSGSVGDAEVDPARPDPWALVELARDVRPDDYATTYVRQAVELSGLDEPLAVAAVVRPPWLAAVAAEPGVVNEDVVAALARFAAIE
jgi:pimeloyl-ACP methyl ester carboxylesterase